MKKVILIIIVLLSLVIAGGIIILSNRATEIEPTKEINEITEIVLPEPEEKEEELPPVKVEVITYNHKDTSSQEYSLPKTKAPLRQGWNYSVDSWETIDDELERIPLWSDIERIIINKYNLEDNNGEKLKGKLLTQTIYSFNEDGNVRDVVKHVSEDDLYSTAISYKYNSNQNLIEMIKSKYDSKLELISIYKYIYEYDLNGNKIEKHEYNSDEDICYKSFYKYSSNGKELEESLYTINDEGKYELMGVIKYEFDNNKLIKQNWQSSQEESWFVINTFNYDSKGNLVKRDIAEEDVWSVCNKEYNSREFCIRKEENVETVGEKMFSIQEYQYKYDEKGNCIEKREYKLTSETLPDTRNLDIIDSRYESRIKTKQSLLYEYEITYR
jgi:hypothetical protein